MWNILETGEIRSTAVLPVDLKENPNLAPERRPSVLYELTVNTLNFCSFACCWNSDDGLPAANDSDASSLLLALPHTLSSEAIDIYEVSIPWSLLGSRSPDLPAAPASSTSKNGNGISSGRLSTIPAPSNSNPKTGLTMCLALPRYNLLVAGYEGGQTLVYTLSSSKGLAAGVNSPAEATTADSSASHAASHALWSFSPIYLSRPHTQPVLSLAVHPEVKFFVTTSADAVLARHYIPHLTFEDGKRPSELVKPVEPTAAREEPPESTLNSRHAGQQGICFRDDGLLFATAGWDGRGRVYRAGSLDSEAGVKAKRDNDQAKSVDGMLNNKGEEKENSSGKVKGKAMKELAVLKWHRDGCYSMAFAHTIKSDLNGNQPAGSPVDKPSAWIQKRNNTAESTKPESGIPQRKEEQPVTEIIKAPDANLALRGVGGLTLSQRREEKAKTMRWLAMGSKDGRVSLWDIF